MKFTVQNRYLHIPICESAEMRRMSFLHNGAVCYALDIKPASERFDFVANIDLARFMGCELELVIEPDAAIKPIFADFPYPNGNFTDDRRPNVHFSVREGWTNDPNGLVEYTSPVTGERTYHMFFQHNPCSYVWGNMHWGHATSSDLLHWTQQEIALFPDDMGTMFSGSAIVDKENRAGFKTASGEDPILLFYTAAGEPFTQCLAYSTDGGKSFTKYAHNPIIPHVADSNRDPKVIFCEELEKYLLALYLTEDIYAIFASEDFKHWEEIQRISLPLDNECPDLYPLTVAETGERKWILSGAHHRYYVCEFKDGKLVPTIEARNFVEQGCRCDRPGEDFFTMNSKSYLYGSISYASQSYSDISDGRRINVAWSQINPQNRLFCCQLSLPMEHKLHFADGNYYLCANPVAEIESLCDSIKELTVTDEAVVELGAQAYDITLDAADESVTLSFAGLTLEIDGIHQIIRANGQLLSPIKLIHRSGIHLRLLLDMHSLELFSNMGEVCAVLPIYMDDNSSLRVINHGNASVGLTVKKLKNIH